MTEEAKSLEQCPVCRRRVVKLYLQTMEGLSVLLCEQCLRDPSVQRRLSILEEDALDDSQFEDEEEDP